MKKLFIILILGLLQVNSMIANVKVSNIFGNKMVLQRNQKNPV